MSSSLEEKGGRREKALPAIMSHQSLMVWQSLFDHTEHHRPIHCRQMMLWLQAARDSGKVPGREHTHTLSLSLTTRLLEGQ